MKALILISLMVISFTACAAKDADKKTDAKAAAKPVDAKAATTTATAPCDTKEDVLKKLEEKKKEAEKGKTFSLQGNTDTGCKVK